MSAPDPITSVLYPTITYSYVLYHKLKYRIYDSSA